jgi:hypothetical protein
MPGEVVVRYLRGFLLVLSLVPLSSSSSAQGTDEGWLEKHYPELVPRQPASETTTDEPPAKPAPGASPVEAPPDQPALQLKADDAGVAVAATPRKTREPGSFSSELRFELAANAFRWSSYVPERSDLPSYGKRSYHVAMGLGVRFYPKTAHGLLLDFVYLFDTDLDSPPSPWLCFWDCPPDLWLTTEFALVHVGYAYRHVVQGPRDPGRLAWAFTPHASLSMGQAYTEASSDTGIYDLVIGAYSPVVGARFGIDVDLHIKRFFMGWTLRYEVLKHTKGPLRATQLLSFNVVPVFHLGAVLGAKVQEN